MAGNYFFDPRPFYGLNNHNLVSLEELFNGKKETAPWTEPRNQHVHYEQEYYPGTMASMDRQRRPEPQPYYIQREYKRPELRDDTYTNYPKPEMRRPDERDGNSNVYDVRPGGEQSRGGNQTISHLKAQNQYNSNMGNQHSNGRKEEGWAGDQRPQGQGPNGVHPKGSAMKQGNMQQQRSARDESSDDDDEEEEEEYSYGRKEVKWADHNNSNSNSNNSYNNNINSRNNNSNSNISNSNSRNSNSSSSNNNNSNGNRGGQDRHNQNGLKQSNNKSSDNEDYDLNRSSAKKNGGQRESNQGYGGHMEGSNSKGSSGKKGAAGQQQKERKSSASEDGGDSSEEESWGGYKAPQGHHHQQGANKQQQLHGGREESTRGGMHQLKQNDQQESKQKNGYAQSLELKVPICCDNCERKVRAALASMNGVEEVLCDQWNRKVTVLGTAKADNVLKRVRRVKKDTELWQQAKQY